MKKPTIIALFITTVSVCQSMAIGICKNKIHFAKADTLNIAEYQGVYKLAPGNPVEQVNVRVADGKVYAAGGEYSETEIKFIKPDQYEEPGLQAIFTFERTNGKVTKLKIIVQDMELIAEKQL
jgi:hypothetical protein